MQIVPRKQSRGEKSNLSTQKTKFDVELPKITRTIFNSAKKQHHNYPTLNINTNNSSFCEHLNWVVQTTNYQDYNQQQIDREHRKLKKELIYLNQQVAKAIQKLQASKLITRKDRNNGVEEKEIGKRQAITEKQILNNQNILQRYRKQYQQLEKRTIILTGVNKDNLDEEISERKELILKIKNKIKELKMKNKDLGNLILNADSNIDDIRKLGIEKDTAEKKKDKLWQKLNSSENQLKKISDKIDFISDDYSIAQNYFKERIELTQNQEKSKKLEIELNHQQYILDISKKKNQSLNQTKQQKYHQYLKELQTLTIKRQNITSKIQEIQTNILSLKNQANLISQNLTDTQKQIKIDYIDSSLNFVTQIGDEFGHNQVATSNKISEFIANDQLEQQIPLSIKHINKEMQNTKQYQKEQIKVIQIINKKKEKLQKAFQNLYSDQDQQQQQIKQPLKEVKSLRQIKQQFMNERVSSEDERDNITTVKEQTEMGHSQLQIKKQTKRQQKKYRRQYIEKKELQPDYEMVNFQKSISQLQTEFHCKNKKQVDKDLQMIRQSIQWVKKTTTQIDQNQNLKNSNQELQ